MNATTTPPSSILRPVAAPNAQFRLFCFPFAGAGAAAYRGWPEKTLPGCEALLVQPPGRENRIREAGYTSLTALAAQLGGEILAWIDRPYALFGHSMGGLLAFEVARWLRRSRAPEPLALFVSASRAPYQRWPDPPVHRLSDRAFLDEIDRRYRSVPPVVLSDPELRELLTPGIRADMTMVETYECAAEPPLPCPIWAFGGSSDTEVTEAELAGWQQQTSAGFSLTMFDRGHIYLQEEAATLTQSIVTACTRRLSKAGEYTAPDARTFPLNV